MVNITYNTQRTTSICIVFKRNNKWKESAKWKRIKHHVLHMFCFFLLLFFFLSSFFQFLQRLFPIRLLLFCSFGQWNNETRTQEINAIILLHHISRRTTINNNKITRLNTEGLFYRSLFCCCCFLLCIQNVHICIQGAHANGTECPLGHVRS